MLGVESKNPGNGLASWLSCKYLRSTSMLLFVLVWLYQTRSFGGTQSVTYRVLSAVRFSRVEGMVPLTRLENRSLVWWWNNRITSTWIV